MLRCVLPALVARDPLGPPAVHLDWGAATGSFGQMVAAKLQHHNNKVALR